MYEDIFEVVEGGMHWANYYLAHGYRLLDIQTGTRAAMFPRYATNPGQAFVRRNPVFVLGRPRDVAWVEAPRRPRPAPEDEKPLEDVGATQQDSAPG